VSSINTVPGALKGESERGTTATVGSSGMASPLPAVILDSLVINCIIRGGVEATQGPYAASGYCTLLFFP
jgi:hypothetical protein